MTRFFTSDSHIGHANILRLGEGRPFHTLNHMHTELMLRHNAIVQPDDEVFFLGDIALGNLEESIQVFKNFNGKKYLVPGNHDKIFSGTNSKKRIETFALVYEEAGFEILEENTSIFIDKQEVILSHFPYTGDHVMNNMGEERYSRNRPKDTGLPLLHGHTHYTTRFTSGQPRSLHIGVDANSFTPVSEHEIEAWLDVLRKQKLI